MTPDSPSEERLVGGIPLDIPSLITNPDQQFTVQGKFGNEEIRIDSHPYATAESLHNYLLNIDTPDYEHFMQAQWHESAYGVSNVVYFEIETQDLKTGARSADFFAGDLADAFMTIVDGLGYPVDNLHFNWIGPYADRDTGEEIPASTNYSQYVEALKTMPPEEAVFQTWEGRRIAKKHGITELGEIKQEGNEFKGILRKPKTT